MSATKLPRPVRNRSSSLRRTDWPNTFVVWAMDSPLPGPHHLTRGRDGVDNARIPGAAADVPRYRGPNSVFRRCVFHLEQLERRKHDPGSAEPALETVVCLERLLNRMEPTVLGEALDRRDLPAVAVSTARRLNTSIIARLSSSLPRRSDAGCPSSDASFAASANAVGPAFRPRSAFSAPVARIGVGPTAARPIRTPVTFRFASRPSWTATPIVAKSPVFRFSFK